MEETAPTTPLDRTHLARHDLDWLPPSMKAVRWTVAGSIWTAIGGAAIATFALGKIQPYIYGKGIAALVAGGYYTGDRVARAVLRRRLHKLARGAGNLSRLSREADGELIHVRGKVRAHQNLTGLLSPSPAVYRRVLFVVGSVRLVHEAAVDFSLVDDSGELVTVQVADARLLTVEPARHKLGREAIALLAALPLPERIGPQLQRWLEREQSGKRSAAITGGEVLLTDGTEVEVVGYKNRVVDPTVQSRMARETPMRATLRSGAELPLLIAPSKG